jgi:alpha-N-arabinofuranosidase
MTRRTDTEALVRTPTTTKTVGRRDFVSLMAAGSAAVVGAGLSTGAWLGTARWHASPAADSRIDVLLDEPLATIAPEIYGHFIEHLGGVIYDGVWVGEDSPIPNVDGIRRALVEALKPIGPAVMRWPGGCFADWYDWRDGVGPRDQRPRRTNFWADSREIRDLGDIPQRFDPNSFGTNEFMRFCRLIGAKPYLAANVRTLPAKVFHEWIEYCNSPAGSTTWADVRGQGGDREPFGVRYWGVGNESWGCGGNFTPEEYASAFRRYSTWAVPNNGVPLAFIGAGPSGGDVDWTRRFFRALRERNAVRSMWGWALHHYCSAGGEAIKYSDTDWYDLLASANRMESLITDHWQVMREVDREHHVKLVVDEWGAWHKMTTNLEPQHLFGQQSTIRDALVAGLTLDTFNRHADKVAMANLAQLINCIHSLFLADGPKFVKTPTYHVFAMYSSHQGGQGVRTVVSAPGVHWTGAQDAARSLWGLNGSASLAAGGRAGGPAGRQLTLTVTNPHLTEPRETEVAVRGGSIRSATATTLAARSVHDVNTFDQPDLITPTRANVRASGGAFSYTFAAASVTKLEISLGA